MASPSIRDVKRLFALSQNRCAFPSCTVSIAEGASVIGEICHIRAASADGPRYDPSQNDDERHSFGNLILLCANHHKVVDDDVEAYTVQRLLRMKAAHESVGVTLPKSSESGEVARTLIDQSVKWSHQSGGLSAHTVNAHTINVQGHDPKNVRALEAHEVLWRTFLGVKAEFTDIIFVDMILTPNELESCFRGATSNSFFEAITCYEDDMLVASRMQQLLPREIESYRLFVTPRIWALYQVLIALFGRCAMLITLSFKKRKLQSWKTDDLMDQHLRSVLTSSVVEEHKKMETGGLQSLVGLLETTFLHETRQNSGATLSAHTGR